jgi:hypothetical protein
MEYASLLKITLPLSFEMQTCTCFIDDKIVNARAYDK